MSAVCFVASCTWATAAFAAVEPEGSVLTDEEVTEAAGRLAEILASGNLEMLLAFIVMLLVFVVRRRGLTQLVSSKRVPWIAVGMGMLGNGALALTSEDPSVGKVLLGGLVVGTSAVGLWELLFRHCLKSKLPVKDEEKAAKTVDKVVHEASSSTDGDTQNSGGSDAAEESAKPET